MSLIFPKKEILYAPMLGTLGGGSARGMGRGIGKGLIVAGEAVWWNNSGGLVNWTVPEGVTSISMVAVGGGASAYKSGSTVYGGGGGGLAYTNNYAVSPGQTIQINSGAGGGSNNSGDTAGDSWVQVNGTIICHAVRGGYTGGTDANVRTPGYRAVGDGGNNAGNGGVGGNPGAGGGGAGGYSNTGGGGGSNGGGGGGYGGAGGGGGYGYGGGGVSIFGENNNGGQAGAGGVGGTAGSPYVWPTEVNGGVNVYNNNGNLQGSNGGYASGGHLGGGQGLNNNVSGGGSGVGGVRIIWSGEIERTFPSTNVGVEHSAQFYYTEGVGNTYSNTLVHERTL